MEVAGLTISVMSCLCAQTCFDEKLARFNYLERPQVKVQRLTRTMERLTAREEIINKKLEHAKVKKGKEPTTEVVLWLRNVQEIKDSVSCIVEEIADETKCLNGCFPNYCSRIKRGKRIEEKIKEVRELLKIGEFSNHSLAYFPLKRGRRLPATTILNNTSKRRAIDEILECLMNDDVARIGIFGMGGVGKTTIMTYINNLLLEQGTLHFDNIIFVTVSKESNNSKLQNDIANALALNLSNDDDETSRATKLLEALERRKRLLLILDDMWQPFPIEAIGIPNPTRENGCKLVLTTRSLVVCRGMETQRDIEVKVLSEEEAWDLFKEKVGDDRLLSLDIESTARNVARECDGLPLAIVTVGLALRNVYDATDWYNALDELRNSTGDIEGMEDRVFARLRFSYNRLRNDKTRLCFIYCALYPEDHQIEIEELIEYWMGEGLLGTSDGRRGDTMRKGKFVLNELKDACMLQTINQDGRVKYEKMHDLIRDMVIGITRMSPRCIIKAGVGLRKTLHESEWREDVEMVSLMRNDVKVLLGQPRCPKLSSLLLQYNSFSENISHSFFNHMHNLKVVDLSYTGIKFLPESLSYLESLRALLLHSCWNLRSLPCFTKLTALQVLDLSYTPIKELPKGMEMLVYLKRLDLSHTNLQLFPGGLLSKFTILEDLLMDNCDFVWGAESSWAIEGGARVEELTSSIANLQINFWDMKAFNRYVMSGHSDQVKSFKLYVGDFRDFHSHGRKNSVVISGYDLINGGTNTIPVLLPVDTLELYIYQCDNISKLYKCFSNLTNLKKCAITWCHQMKYFMVARKDRFPSLESLRLHNMYYLMGLRKGIQTTGTLAKLKVLDVDTCPTLKSLFFRGQLQHLENLQEIKVSNCIGIKEIIAEDENHEMGETSDNAILILSRLQRLELQSLRNLETICSGVLLVVCDSLRSIDVLNCEKLTTLSLCLGDEQSPSLREIKGEKLWWDSLEWADPNTKTLLQPFFKATDIETCMFFTSSLPYML
ncbi:hypothetical protein HHK36_003759 [Tetracentron sinense]|uniref:NB-ARC domain-containing protein n=1 Tax=Tetracentron sinense TaxID=13715 RepID=A0A834ZPL7_TETSI|nr:hypothetical protein HHK36_003759 [Tetracentron sinense]